MNKDIREFHEISCEEQPEEFPCICDRLVEEEYDKMVELQLLDILHK